MFYIILFILIIGGIASIIDFARGVLTLEVLPNAIGIFDGKIDTYAIKLLSIIEGPINYIGVLIINIIDFIAIPITYVPFLSEFMMFVYRSPDLLERLYPKVFGVHRSIITHSIINPIFIGLMIGGGVLIQISRIVKIDIIFRYIIFTIGMVFICHLLADTMPQRWMGFANIKAFGIVLPAFLSKIWLWINVIFGIGIVAKVSTVGMDG